MERHGDNRQSIRQIFKIGDRLRQQFPQRLGHSRDPLILQQMNHRPQRAFIHAIGYGLLERRPRTSAQLANRGHLVLRSWSRSAGLPTPDARRKWCRDLLSIVRAARAGIPRKSAPGKDEEEDGCKACRRKEKRRNLQRPADFAKHVPPPATLTSPKLGDDGPDRRTACEAGVVRVLRSRWTLYAPLFFPPAGFAPILFFIFARRQFARMPAELREHRQLICTFAGNTGMGRSALLDQLRGRVAPSYASCVDVRARLRQA